jgi:hypothetical protein
MKLFKFIFGISLVASFAIMVSLTGQEITLPSDNQFLTTHQAHYTSLTGTEAPTKEDHVPIPLKDRVFNLTGTQCVYCACETLGRWNEEPKLVNPPLTSRPECKSYSDPLPCKRVLDKLGVKFEQTYDTKENSFKLLRKATQEGRGALFGVPGHAMVCVHFDEENDVFKYIDNADRSLKIQTVKLSRFKNYMNSWALIIYPDKEVVEYKVARLIPFRLLPIVDRNNPQGTYSRDYIPIPR